MISKKQAARLLPTGVAAQFVFSYFFIGKMRNKAGKQKSYVLY